MYEICEIGHEKSVSKHVPLFLYKIGFFLEKIAIVQSLILFNKY